MSIKQNIKKKKTEYSPSYTSPEEYKCFPYPCIELSFITYKFISY